MRGYSVNPGRVVGASWTGAATIEERVVGSGRCGRSCYGRARVSRRYWCQVFIVLWLVLKVKRWLGLARSDALAQVGPSIIVKCCKQAAPDKRTITQPQYCIDINRYRDPSNSKNLPKNTRSKIDFSKIVPRNELIAIPRRHRPRPDKDIPSYHQITK